MASRVTLCELPVLFLEMTARSSGALQKAGLLSIGQVDNRTDAELAKIPGIGPAGVEDIRAAVDAFRYRIHRVGFDDLIERYLEQARQRAG